LDGKLSEHKMYWII